MGDMTAEFDPDVDASRPGCGSFEAWYRAAHPRLLAALVVATGDLDAARDATSEAFTRALQHWPRVHAMDAPEAWVHRVGINVLRRRHRRRILEERLLRRQRVEPAAPPQVATEIWDALAALPLRQRQALALRYLLGMTQAEVAEAMGVVPGTAAATLHAARRNLAGRLRIDDTDDTEVASPWST
jgi:RNA polymerase sigma-70 factor (ECF subfamily)